MMVRSVFIHFFCFFDLNFFLSKSLNNFSKTKEFFHIQNKVSGRQKFSLALFCSIIYTLFQTPNLLYGRPSIRFIIIYQTDAVAVSEADLLVMLLLLILLLLLLLMLRLLFETSPITLPLLFANHRVHLLLNSRFAKI